MVTRLEALISKLEMDPSMEDSSSSSERKKFPEQLAPSRFGERDKLAQIQKEKDEYLRR